MDGHRRRPAAGSLRTALGIGVAAVLWAAAGYGTAAGAGPHWPAASPVLRRAAAPPPWPPAVTSAPPSAVTSTPPSAVTSAPPGAAASPSPPERITYPAAGGGRWTVAAAQRTPAAGAGGRRLRYRVAVERDIRGLPAPVFADAVTATLADPRGWTAGGRWRLLRVGPRDAHDFTVFLATPGTRDRLCDNGSDGYTSCRNGDSVVLNVARWVKGVPHDGGDLAAYRRYLVNHEVGHRLGNGHERCPGRGRPAPVMQQQTLGLHGCTLNPWPYLGGKRYAGRSGAYDDRPPPRDRGQS